MATYTILSLKKLKDTDVDFFEEYEKQIMCSSINQEFVDFIKNFKGSLFINSSTPDYIIKKYLTKYNITNYFKETLGVEFSKSKIKKFEYLIKKYDLKDFYFITDTLGDIKEANKLNIKTIAVDFGFHSRETLAKGRPFKIISSFKELM